MIKYFTIEDLLKHYLQKKFHILEKRKEFLQKICSLIQKKLEKGKTISEIADDLEDTEENISHLIEQFHLGRKES